jgi:hypothetical protein
MRTLISLRRTLRATIAIAAVVGLFALAMPAASAADGTIDVPLTFDPQAIDVTNGFVPTTITVSGTQCVPKDGFPASVTMTIDNFDGQVRTASPDADGNWSITLLVTSEDVGPFHAACDDYLGSLSYPEAVLPLAAVLPISDPGVQPPLASTGSRNGWLSGLAALLIGVGAVMTWAGRRPRRST